MEKGPSALAYYWTSEESEVEHYYKHGEKMFFTKIIKYSQAAKRFAESKESGIKEFKAKNGSRYRYDSKTNKFIIISKDGKIVTYFEPTRGLKYFEGEFDGCGEFWINR